MKSILISIFSALSFFACATTPTVDDSLSTKVDPDKNVTFKLKKSPAKLMTGTSDYKFEGKTFKAQWFQCIGKTNAGFVAFFHDDTTTNNPQSFCDDWPAQVLLKNGFNVVAVNRPGFTGSTGEGDLGGPQSVAASTAGLKTALGSGGNLVGFWGIESGVIAATFTAKSWPNVKWLILGGGYYDIESLERESKNRQLVKLIASLKKVEGEKMFESRSIAWDITGLPSMMALYHSKADDSAPKQQADDFNAQLRTAQTRVFYDEVDAPAGKLPWQAQYEIVDKAIKNLTKSK
jgi:hypothetical protein